MFPGSAARVLADAVECGEPGAVHYRVPFWAIHSHKGTTGNYLRNRVFPSDDVGRAGSTNKPGVYGLVGDLIIRGTSPNAMVENLEKVLERLEGVGLYVAAHKCRFYEPSVKWCGKIYSGQGVSHDRD